MEPPRERSAPKHLGLRIEIVVLRINTCYVFILHYYYKTTMNYQGPESFVVGGSPPSVSNRAAMEAGTLKILTDPRRSNKDTPLLINMNTVFSDEK